MFQKYVVSKAIFLLDECKNLIDFINVTFW